MFKSKLDYFTEELKNKIADHGALLKMGSASDQSSKQEYMKLKEQFEDYLVNLKLLNIFIMSQKSSFCSQTKTKHQKSSDTFNPDYVSKIIKKEVEKHEQNDPAFIKQFSSCYR